MQNIQVLERAFSILEYTAGKSVEVTCSALAGDKSNYSLFYKQGKKDLQILDKSRKSVVSAVKDGKICFQPSGWYLNYFLGTAK